MDWGKGASGQYTISPRPHPITRSQLLSGTQVRWFKHNPRTCPNWTLDICQGRGLQAATGAFLGTKRLQGHPTVAPYAPLIAGSNSPLSSRYGKIGKIGHLGWPTRVGICGDLVKRSPDSQALISPLVPCIGVCLAVTLAACCSPRGWSRDGAENSKGCKIWQRGTLGNLHSSG